MKKVGRRVLALFIAVVMVLGSNGIVMAAESTGEIPVMDGQDLVDPDSGAQNGEDSNDASSEDQIMSLSEEIPDEAEEVSYGPTLQGDSFYANGIPVTIYGIADANEEDGAVIAWSAGTMDGNSWDEGVVQVGPETIVFGGSAEGTLSSTSVTMNGGTVQAIYGAGSLDVVQETKVVLGGGTVTGAVFGGGEYSQVEKTNVEVTAAGKFDAAGNPVTELNAAGESVQLPAVVIGDGIYAGNDSCSDVSAEANVTIKNGNNADNGKFSAGLNIQTVYTETDAQGNVTQYGSVGENCEVTVSFDSYTGEFAGTIADTVDVIETVNGSEVTLAAELEGVLGSAVSEGSAVCFGNEEEQDDPDTEEPGAEDVEEPVSDAQDEEPGVVDDGIAPAAVTNVELSSAIMYIHDLYPDNIPVDSAVAHFYKEDPTTSTGAESYDAEMTKLSGEEYGVRVPVDSEGYQFVRFTYYDEIGDVIDVHVTYQYAGDPLESTVDRQYVKYIAGEQDCVFIGKGGLRSYISKHLDSTAEPLDYQVLYFNMEGSGYQLFTGTKTNGGGSTESYSYLKLYFTDKDAQLDIAEDDTKVKHDANGYYFEVTDEASMNDDCYYIVFPGGYNLTTETKLRLYDQRTTLVDSDVAAKGQVRFYYSFSNGKNMITPANLENAEPFWGVYQTGALSGTTRNIAFDNFLVALTAPQIRWSTNNGTSWSDWTNMTETPEEISDVETQLTYIWGSGNVPVNATHVQFRGYGYVDGSSTNTQLYSSGTLAIPNTYDNPCWYAHRQKNANNNNVSTTLDGYWNTAYAVNTNADGHVDIQTGTFQWEENAYYGTANFYDYYSRNEFYGTAPNNGWQYEAQSLIFNQALNKFYSLNNITAQTMYFGVGEYQNQRYGQIFTGVDISSFTNLDSASSGKDMIRSTTAGAQQVYPNLMDDTLSKDGTITQQGTASPLFNSAWLRGANAYGIALGQVYQNVSFPFTKNADGYWEYDSAEPDDALIMQKDVNEGYYLKRTSPVENDEGKGYGFFPFDDATATNYDSQHYFRNDMFGMQMTIPFTLTDDKTVTVKGTDETTSKEHITFEFTGDDDVWIYVDDTLVLDLGGIHSTASGSIDFTDGTITYGPNTTTSLDPATQTERKTYVEGLSVSEAHTLTIFYLERGLNHSNLKMTFNFPQSSTLEVSNSVTIPEGVNSVFSEALNYLGGFNYEISNQVTSGGETPVVDSAGYMSAGNHEPVSVTGTEPQTSISMSQADNVVTYANTLGATLDANANNWDEIQKRLGTINISNFDSSNYAYLRMEINSSVASQNGGSLYVALQDNVGNIVGGWASSSGYNSYSNSLYANSWSTVRIDLKSLARVSGDTFDYDNISAVKIGFRSNAELQIRNMEMYEEVVEQSITGFQVDQDDISDYGSYTTEALSPADGAWYEHYNSSAATTGKPTMVDNGTFSLADGQSAVFTDKFRFGSYIYLNEQADSRIFDTSWSLTEAGVSIASGYLNSNRGNMETVANGSVSNLDNVVGTMVNDGRTSLDTSGNAVSLNGADGAFVFRNYEDPDDTISTPVDLRVAYENVLKYGSITIEKRIDLTDMSDELVESLENTSYEFRVQFGNVAGRALETNVGDGGYLQLTTTVTVGDTIQEIDGTNYLVGTTTVAGIPAGTYYEIKEVQANGVEVTGVAVGNSDADADPADYHSIYQVVGPKGSVAGYGPEVTEADVAEPYVLAIAYASNQGYIFTNKINGSFNLAVRKDWKTENGLNTNPAEGAEDPNNVYVWLQYSVDGGKTWLDADAPQGYTKPEGADENDDRWIVKTANEDHTATFENIESIVGGHAAIYRVREYNVENFTAIYSVQTDGTYVVSNIPTDEVLYVQSGRMTSLEVFLAQAADIQGLSISDVRIKDEHGNDVTARDTLFEIVSDEENGGNITGISYNAPSTGSATYRFTFTYADAESATQSASIDVLIYAYAMNDDIYVLDYGLPAELSDQSSSYNLFANDVYEIDDNTDSTYKVSAQQSTQAVNGSGKLDIADASGKFQTDTTSVIYTPTKFMDTVDEFKYETTIYGTGDETVTSINATNGVVMDATIKVMPASVVYYEDNFNNTIDEDGNYTNKNDAAGIVYSGNYAVNIEISEDRAEADDTMDYTQSIDQSEVYGHDSVYDNSTGDSLGSSTQLNAGTSGVTKATFTFTGTGFEIIGRTDLQSAKITYYVRNNATKKFVAYGTIDTFYEDSGEGGLYQIPVIKETGLEKNSYTVMLQVPRGTGYFILDGIRIHNPLDAADTENYLATEQNTSVVNVRDMVLGTSDLANQGVFSLNPEQKPEGATAAIMSNNGTDTNLIALGATVTEVLGQHSDVTNAMEDYLVAGPKNELYLSKGNALAFIAVADDTENKTLQVEAKAVNTRANGSYAVPTLANVGSNGIQEIQVPSSVAMYYALDMSLCRSLGNNKYLVILTNTSDTDISLSNLKYKGYTFEYPDDQYSMPETVEIDEETTGSMDNALDGIYTDTVTTDDAVEVVSATFASRTAKLGEYAYLNITLRDVTYSYSPVIYRYTAGAALEDITANETLIDQNSLRSVRSYTKTVTGSDGTETSVTYTVFKVKVLLDAGTFSAGDVFFAVGASNGEAYCKQDTVKKAAIAVTANSTESADPAETVNTETENPGNVENTETQNDPVVVSETASAAVTPRLTVSYSVPVMDAEKEAELINGMMDAGTEVVEQTEEAVETKAVTDAEEVVETEATEETENTDKEESASKEVTITDENAGTETDSGADSEESQGGILNAVKSFFSNIVSKIRSLFTR